MITETWYNCDRQPLRTQREHGKIPSVCNMGAKDHLYVTFNNNSKRDFLYMLS